MGSGLWGSGSLLWVQGPARGERGIFSKGRGWGLGGRRLGQEEIGPALGGARVGTEEGSHRCSIEAGRTCRRGRRRPGRAPPSPRHSHRQPPRPQLGPRLPPQALPPVAIATPFVPASPARPARHQAADAGPGTGVIPQDAQKGGVSGHPLPGPPTQSSGRDWLTRDPPRYCLVPPTTGAYSL